MDGPDRSHQRAGPRRFACRQELQPGEIREPEDDVGSRPSGIELAVVGKECEDRGPLAGGLAHGQSVERENDERQAHGRAGRATDQRASDRRGARSDATGRQKARPSSITRRPRAARYTRGAIARVSRAEAAIRRADRRP